jgi:hypothetical protein
MRLHKQLPNTLKQADVPALESPASCNADVEYDRAFRDFIASIAVTADQLAAIISMPELSIREVKRFLQDGKKSGAEKSPSSSGYVVPQVHVPPQAGGYSTPPLIDLLPRVRLAPVA